MANGDRIIRHRRRLLLQQGGLCFYCGRPVTDTPGHWEQADAATIDHVVPRAHGGTSRARNLVVACRACNVAKGGRYTNPYPGWS